MRPAIVLFIIVLIGSCSDKSGIMVSKSEKEIIAKEIRKEIDSLILGCESLNMDLAFGVFSDDSEFYMIASDGYFYNYETFLKNNKSYFETCSTFEITTEKLDIKVLAPDIAVVSWIYRVVATLKDGDRDIFDHAGATFVFQRNENEWKVITYHESSIPPIRIKKEVQE